MTEPEGPEPSRLLALSATETRGLDRVDTSLRRLLSLRTRIETNWPITGGLFGRRPDLPPIQQATIADLFTSLPTPLPMHAGGEPEPIILASDVDMRAIAGRAVDAAFALLDGATLETIYPADVTMLATRGFDSAGPITVSGATVGLLVATIIGTLEAISEIIVQAPPNKVVKAKPRSEPKPSEPKHVDEPKRGPSVPRI
ncbi:MAG TPA: hypothetical protein VF337_02425 [Candidatus Limnocylindrales bacterium]